jgi:hypothetical protein
MLVFAGGCKELVERPGDHVLPLNPEPSSDTEPVSRGGTEVGSPLRSFEFIFDASELAQNLQLDLCWVGTIVNGVSDFIPRTPEVVQLNRLSSGTNARVLQVPKSVAGSSLDSINVHLAASCGSQELFAMRLWNPPNMSLTENDLELEFLYPVQSASGNSVTESIALDEELAVKQPPSRYYLVHRPLVNCVNRGYSIGQVSDSQCLRNGEIHRDIQQDPNRPPNIPGGGVVSPPKVGSKPKTKGQSF